MGAPELKKMTHEEIAQLFSELKTENAELRQALATKNAKSETENRFRLLFENAPMPYQSLDEKGLFLDVNQCFLDLLGYSKEELIGKDFGNILHPDWVDHFKQNFPRFKAVGEVLGVEFDMIKKDGSSIQVFFNGKIQHDVKGNFQRTHCIFHDITYQKAHETRLREERDYMFQIFNSITQYVAVVSTDYRYEFINLAMLNLFEKTGCSADSHELILNTPCYNFTGEEQPCPYCPISDLLKKADVESMRYTHEIFGRILEGNATKLMNLDGSLSILLVMEDVTGKKKAEEELEQFFNVSMDLFCIADIHGNFLKVNNAWENLLGDTVDELERTNFMKFIHPGDIDATLDAMSQLAQQKKIHNFVNRFRNNDGSYCFLEWRSFPKGAFIYAAARDITERMMTEKTLTESEERFSKAFRSSPAPQVISDIATGKFIEVNDRWVEMLGYSKEEQIGRTSKEVGIWADPGERDRLIQEIQRNGFFKAAPIKFKNRASNIVHALWSAEAITLGGRQVMLSMIYDETEHKKAKEEQMKLQAQLNQAQKMESVGRLAGGVAHDFNNMLSIINGYAEISLEKLDPTDPLHENLQEIHTAGRRSAKIVRQLLAFARKQTVSPLQIDLNETVVGLIKMLQPLIGENIDLAWSPGNNLWPIKIDPSQIDQIMANLAVNARDAIPDVGKMTIETKNITFDTDYCRTHAEFMPGEYVMLAVSDDGCGMNQEILDKLFEPFFTTKDPGKGTGLGLATIYGIVKQNNGFINVYSEPGEGTTFKIYLPRHETNATVFTSAADKLEALPRGSETILLVEDEPAILRMSKNMLERLGYTVLTAKRPTEALILAKENAGHIHLLITDVIMPDMNGRDLAGHLQILKPDTKTLYMSGYTANVIAHHGVLDEGVIFIQKPFSLQGLAIKVREAIERDKAGLQD